jgi:predicted ATPase
MKLARAEDHWRRLKAKGQPNYIDSITATSVTNFPAATIRIPGPITVITGLNGVGKSTIIHAMHLLAERGSHLPLKLALLKNCNGSIVGDVISGGQKIPAKVDLDSGSAAVSPATLDIEVTWIDAAFEIPKLVQSLRAEQNLGEALAQLSPNVYSAHDLKEVSWLVGKSNESCSAFELEGFYDRSITPYFTVESQGSMYGMESMGLGEASLHYIFWALKRAENNSLLLIEEPETYVSARSQGALMDTLAQCCLTKNCTAIVTTHSPQVFAKVPPEDTLVLVQSASGPRIVVRNTQAGRLAALAVPPVNEKAGYFLVEDRMAREFTKCWLKAACPDLYPHWRVVDMGSSSAVIKSLDNFPKSDDQWFRAVGLLDGDEQNKGHQTTGIIAYLPTNDPPEVILRGVIAANVKEIAESLGFDEDDLHIALSALEGSDHHDWFLGLVSAFAGKGLQFETLVEVSVDLWMKLNDQISNMAVEALLRVIGADA